MDRVSQRRRLEANLAAPPTEAQAKDLDYLQVLGQLFTQIVYAQLILESAALAIDHGETRPGSVSDLTDLTEAHVDRMAAVFVGDMSGYAVELHGQASATDEQAKAALVIVRKPVIDRVMPLSDGVHAPGILERREAFGKLGLVP